MPKPTRQMRLMAALEARGYVPNRNPRTTRYAEYTHPAIKTEKSPLRGPTEHRVLVGSNGALRWTTGPIVGSVAFSDGTVDKLLVEGAVELASRKSKP